jgi:hypothetical protein
VCFSTKSISVDKPAREKDCGLVLVEDCLNINFKPIMDIRSLYSYEKKDTYTGEKSVVLGDIVQIQRRFEEMRIAD